MGMGTLMVSAAEKAPPVEAIASGEMVRDRLLPAFAHRYRSEIEKEMNNILEELNRGFEREQFISVSLLEVLKDQIPEIEEQIQKYSSDPETWQNAMTALSAMRLQARFLLRIEPEADRLSVELSPTDRPADLARFKGSVRARPILKLKEVLELRLVEVGHPSEPDASRAFPRRLTDRLSEQFTAQLPEVDLLVNGSLRARTRGDAAVMAAPLELTLDNVQSTFGSVKLPQTEINHLLDLLKEEANVQDLVATALSLPTFRESFRRQEGQPSLLELDVKKRLESTSIFSWVWLDSSGNADAGFSLSVDQKPEKFLRAQEAGNVQLATLTEVPLVVDDAEVVVDPQGRRIIVRITPPGAHELDTKILEARIPLPGMDDLPLKGMNVRVLATNQQEPLEIEAPLEVKDGVLTLQEGPPKVNLATMSSLVWRRVEIQADGSDQSLVIESSLPLKQQIESQLPALSSLSRAVIDQGRISEMMGQLSQTIEAQVFGRAWQIDRDKLSLSLQISDEGVPQTGVKVACDWDSATPWSASDVQRSLSHLPREALEYLPALQQSSLVEINCRVQLPRSLRVRLDRLRSNQDQLGPIEMNLITPMSEPDPVLHIRARVVRDSSTGNLVGAISDMNIAEVLKRYEMPLVGENAPSISYVIPGDPVKRAATQAPRILSTLWHISPIRRLLDGAPYPAQIVKWAGDAGTAAMVREMRELEVQTVIRDLQKGLEDLARQGEPEIHQAVWNLLNGNLESRSRLAKAMGSELRRPTATPTAEERGLLGRIDHLSDQRLQDLDSSEYLQEPVGNWTINEDQNLQERAEQKVAEQIQKIFYPSVSEELEEVSRDVTSATDRWLSQAVANNASALDRAIMDFLVKRRASSDSSYREVMQQKLNEKLLEAIQKSGNISQPNLQIPPICGVTAHVEPAQLNLDWPEIFRTYPEFGDEPPRAPLRNEPKGPGVSIEYLKKWLEEDDAIPVSLSTEFLTEILDSPENRTRFSEIILGQVEAEKPFGITDELKIEIPKIQVGVDKHNQLSVRATLKVTQPPKGFQKIIPILGHLIDTASVPFFDLKGEVELEVPVRFAIDDYYDVSSGRLSSHQARVEVQTEGFKIRSQSGWQTLVGDQALKRVELEARSLVISPRFDKPLSLPGFEEVLAFQLGPVGTETMEDVVRIDPLSRDDFGPGVVTLRAVPHFSFETLSWPKFEVRR
jgi:hypothetical protein